MFLFDDNPPKKQKDAGNEQQQKRCRDTDGFVGLQLTSVQINLVMKRNKLSPDEHQSS